MYIEIQKMRRRKPNKDISQQREIENRRKTRRTTKRLKQVTREMFLASTPRGDRK